MSECVDEWVCGSVDEWVWMKECVGAMLLVPLTCVQDVIRYSLVGDTIDQEFFYLNEDSGFISLRKTLLTTTTSQFRVRPHLLFRHLSDYGRPAPKPPFTTLQLKVGPLPFHHLSVHGASPPPYFRPLAVQGMSAPSPFCRGSVYHRCLTQPLSLFGAYRVLRKARSTTLFSSRPE